MHLYTYLFIYISIVLIGWVEDSPQMKPSSSPMGQSLWKSHTRLWSTQPPSSHWNPPSQSWSGLCGSANQEEGSWLKTFSISSLPVLCLFVKWR